MAGKKMADNVAWLEMPKRDLTESACFSDSCPANDEIIKKNNELLKQSKELRVYKETIKDVFTSHAKRKHIEKEVLSIEKLVVEFQNHLEKVAMQNEIAALRVRVNVLEQKSSDQNRSNRSNLKFIGDPNNPFAPKFVNQEAKEKFWKSNYTLDQMLEDAERDNSIE